MFTNLQQLLGFQMAATDGQIGIVHDFIFEDSSWIIRYLVINTAGWLPGKRVLISPVSVRSIDLEHGLLQTQLTQAQIRYAPGVDAHPTVSRRHEMELADYYNWPRYWDRDAYRDWKPLTTLLRAEQSLQPTPEGAEGLLRSVLDVTGYRIHAVDGRIGHVGDFVLCDADWLIHYLVVDTRNWVPGKRVLVAPQWITRLNWDAREITVSLTRQEVRKAPLFEPGSIREGLFEPLETGR